MNGCELGEVLLSSLAVGACFELTLTKKTFHGIVLEHRAGSTLVDLGFARQNWCLEAQVVPAPKADPKTWLLSQTQKENAAMAKNGKEKAPKGEGLLVTRYEATSKKHEAFLDETKKSFAALAYRVVVADGPVTFDEIWQKIYRSVTAGTEGKTPKNTVRASLSILVKQGFLRYIKTREEAVAA